MHQGNLKVAPNGDLVALDFGIMGRIDEYTRRVYAEILYGFHPQGLPPRGRSAFRSRIRAADRDVGEFAQALGPWESRSSAWMPAASPWRGFWRISSR
jgi:ubiquinone biosynthesis protein